MAFGFARVSYIAYRLSRMEAAEPGLSITLSLPSEGERAEAVESEADEHRHSDGCACHLRGE
jgi:hypothetical protein